MLTYILILVAIAFGLYFLVRGNKAFPNAEPIGSLRELYAFTRNGEVLDVKSRTETTISATTTNGSTLLIDGVGTTSPATTTVRTSSVEVTRMFLRDDTGQEFQVELEDIGFGIRQGHRVVILYGGNIATQSGYPMAVANLTTNQSTVLPHRVEWLLRRRSTSLGCAALAIVPFLTMLFASVLIAAVQGGDPRQQMSSATLFGGVALLAVGALLLLGRQRTEKLKKDIISALDVRLSQS